MTEAEEWKQYSAELRQIAVRADDAERQRKLLDLAERWAQFAEELSRADHVQHHMRDVIVGRGIPSGLSR